MGGVGCEDATVQGAGSEETGETPMGGAACLYVTVQGAGSEEMGGVGCEYVTAHGADSEEMGETERTNFFAFLATTMKNQATHIEDVLICKVREWRYKWVVWAAAAMAVPMLKRQVVWVAIFVARLKRQVVWVTISVVLILAMPSIFLDENYNDFADQRLLLPGIPHTLNVVSSIPFSFVGLAGIIMFLCKYYFRLCSRRDLVTWIPLFVCLMILGFGSSYYHLNPRDTNCDTLPMIIAFTSTVCIFVVEWFDDWVGQRSFAPPFRQSSYWLWAAGFYLLARVGEVADRAIYRWTFQIFSGHTVEHLCAAVATALSTLALAKRSMEIEPESLRSPVPHHLRIAFMACLWAPRMICLLVLDIVTVVLANMYDLIMLLWEITADWVVDCFCVLVMTSEKQSVSKTRPLAALQTIMMQRHPDLWGIDDYMCKVHKFLESELRHDSVLGLWGPSGVGKSRLLRHINTCYGGADSPFRHIIATEDADVSAMQLDLAACLHLDWNIISLSQEHTRANIFSELLKHDSFLLLLNDVQDGDLDLASIGLPMPLGIRQKVILTSKSQAVCGRMGCSEANTVEMKCLGEEDAWNLFQYKAGVKITEDNAEIHKIAKLMVSACGGLPRTICSIGIGVARVTCCGTDRYDWCIAYELFKANDLPSSGLGT